MRIWRVISVGLVCMMFAGMITRAEEDSLSRLLPYSEETNQATLLNAFADQFFYKNFDSTCYYASQALEIAREKEQADEELKALVRLALVNQLGKNEKESQVFFSQAHAVYERYVSPVTLIQYNYFKGISYLYQTQLDSSLYHLRKALQYCHAYDDEKYQLRALINIGSIFWTKGISAMALDYYIKGSHLADSLGDRRLQLYALFNMGIIYNSEGDMDKAVSYFHKSFNLAKELEDINIQGAVNNNLMVIGLQKNQLDSAINHGREAIRCFQKLGNKGQVANVNVNMGKAFVRKNQLDSARLYTRKAEEMLNETYSLKEVINLRFLQYDLAMSRRYYQSALGFLKSGYHLAATNQLTEDELAFLNAFSFLFEELGAYKKALKYSNEARTLQDSLYSFKRAEQMAFLQETYELDQKQKENDFLKVKNKLTEIELREQGEMLNTFVILFLAAFICAGVVSYHLINRNRQNKRMLSLNAELEHANDELAAANKTKNRFFSIMAHDLKSPLTTIISITDLMMNNFNGDSTREENQSFLLAINDSATTLFNLLDNILYWSRSRMGLTAFNPVVVDMDELVKEVLTMYKPTGLLKKIDLKYETNGGGNIIADKNMVHTVLRNLVSNALKYTHSTGEVSVRCYMDEESFHLLVTDNGIGMKKEMLNRIMEQDVISSSQGTAGELGSGLGLLLCKEFVAKHHGALQAESSPEQGTTFKIILPLVTEKSDSIA
ncbi:hypothetical protein DMA11_12760 [Marinilabiliaceae bacterium JC017]|nr:hypothetical protein DMA11_12760 [Marinilabiliaceae bacterium JC017]